MNNSRKAVLIGSLMMIVGMTWLMVNGIRDAHQTESEVDEAKREVKQAEKGVNEAQREVEELNHQVDAALRDCLEVAGYLACLDVAVNDCMQHGKGYDECLLQFTEMYSRATGV